MNDAERERILDARIMRRLATDRAYRNAESAADQSARELEVELEEEARLVAELEAPRAGGIPGDGWKPGRTVAVND